MTSAATDISVKESYLFVQGMGSVIFKRFFGCNPCKWNSNRMPGMRSEAAGAFSSCIAKVFINMSVVTFDTLQRIEIQGSTTS